MRAAVSDIDNRKDIDGLWLRSHANYCSCCIVGQLSCAAGCPLVSAPHVDPGL